MSKNEFSPEEKLLAIAEGLSGKKDKSQITKELGISRQTYYEWERELIQQVKSLWSRSPGRKPKDKLLKELEEKEKEIYQLKRENYLISEINKMFQDLERVGEEESKKNTTQQEKKRLS